MMKDRRVVIMVIAAIVMVCGVLYILIQSNPDAEEELDQAAQNVEDAAENLGDAAENTGDAISEVDAGLQDEAEELAVDVEELGEQGEEVGEEVEEAAEDAAEGTGDVLEEAGDNLEENTDELEADTDTDTDTDVDEFYDPSTALDEDDTVYDVLRTTPGYEPFATLVEEAGLVELLEEGDGPYTVFVPSPVAMEDAREDYDLDDSEAVRDFVLRHIVEDDITSEELRDISELGTLGDMILIISRQDDIIYINEVIQVKTVDLDADNGIIYEIDAIIPPAAAE